MVCVHRRNVHTHTKQWVISYARKRSAVGNGVYSRVESKTRNTTHPPPFQPHYGRDLTPSKNFYAIHGTHKNCIFTKWFGKGGAEQATKHRGDLSFHGFIDREAAEYYLTIPNVIAAQDWAKSHGKNKKWRDFAPETGGIPPPQLQSPPTIPAAASNRPRRPRPSSARIHPPPPPHSTTNCLQQIS